MSPRPEYLRLCRLLDNSLRPFSDLSAGSVTEELEKDLLIVLSEVLRQIMQWNDGIDSLRDSDTNEELLEESADKGECCSALVLYVDNRHCLARIIGNLISLLAVYSRFARHLLSNVLVTIAGLFIASESGWDDFTHLLCLCLESAICNTLSSSSEPIQPSSDLENRYLVHYSSDSKSFLNLKLKSANLLVAASIFRVLRVIMKKVKRLSDDKFMKLYLERVSALILNVPWSLLGKIYIDCDAEVLKPSAGNASSPVKVDQSKQITDFYGSFIQFLCSTVKQISCLEAGLSFSPVIHKICYLVPGLVTFCCAEFQSSHHVRVSHYLRHKVLILMINLGSHFHIDGTILVAWMHVLHNVFEDLLLQPISGVEIDKDSSLEDSPFCTSLSGPEKQMISSRHLQRLIVFLFLRCSLNLVNMEESTEEHGALQSKNPKFHFTSEQKLDPKYCNKMEGLMQLHRWLQVHAPADIFLRRDLYFQRCARFALSFLQLFIHEDDILFEMLLQLLHAPFLLDHQVVGGKHFSEMKNDPLFLASDVFNPVYIFHLFLAEILYDHQVLLDYLISNDTGSSCAEYLLRSLRLVCNSWNLFVEFPGVEEDSDNTYSKRRKLLAYEISSELLAPMQLKNGVISSQETVCNKGLAYGRTWLTNCRSPYVAAKDCLLSLRTSIDSLNQKNLFPYNPQVLLRRLRRFEELSSETS